MGEIKKEVLSTVNSKELKNLRNLTIQIFSKIGTQKSRQRLIYDLLNSLKTNDKKRFLEIILKKLNDAQPREEKIGEFAQLLNNLYITYDTSENFGKIAYTIIMGIMSIREENES